MQATTVPKAPFRVLYVENNPQLASTFDQKFSPAIQVSIQPNRDEALSYLELGNPVDLVVFNDSLGLSEFLRSIHLKAYFQNLPIILLSDRESIDLTDNLMRGHVVDVFPFNYSVKALQTRLNYFVQKKEYLEADRTPYKPTRIRMPVGKRIFDIAVSFTALFFISPLLLIVSILVRLDSKGPIFYRSKRVGMGYRIFDMYKFRTMRTDADKMLSSMASLNMYNTAVVEDPDDDRCEACQLAGIACQRPLFLDNEQVCEDLYHKTQKAKATFSKFKEDPRVTKLGKFLRNTSIDELPQLFNILRGDMSFVGNRPLPPYEAEKLTATAYARRFAAPAGLTGLWQVTKRGKSKVSDQERIQLDVLYAKKYSFKTDLLIMLQTVKAVFQKENV